MAVAKEDIEQFVTNYIGKHNRATAWHYSYVVQEAVQRTVPCGCGEVRVYRHEGGVMTEHEIDSYNADFPNETPIDKDKLEYVGDFVTEHEDVQWFFTEQAAEEYIARDGHDLRNTRTYVKHFKHNREAELILRTLFEVAGKDYDQDSR